MSGRAGRGRSGTRPSQRRRWAPSPERRLLTSRPSAAVKVEVSELDRPGRCLWLCQLPRANRSARGAPVSWRGVGCKATCVRGLVRGLAEIISVKRIAVCLTQSAASLLLAPFLLGSLNALWPKCHLVPPCLFDINVYCFFGVALCQFRGL